MSTFGTPGVQGTPGLVGPATTPASGMNFGQTSTAGFGTPGHQGALVPFQGGALPNQQQQQQSQSAINVQTLVTSDGRWASHGTKFGDIHPEGQKQLLQLEQHIRRCRKQCSQLDRCDRLHSSSQSQRKDMEAEAHALRQALQQISTRHRVHDQAGLALRERVLELMRNVEASSRALERSSFVLKHVLGSQAQVLPASIRDRLLAPVTLPSPFLRHSMRTFEELANQCTAVVSQQLTMVEATRPYTAEAVQALPASLCNLHAYLTHVAAKIERLADGVSTARAAFLARRRQAGQYTNPFVEADENEAAAQQAAKRQPVRAAAQAPGAGMQPNPAGLPSPAPAPASSSAPVAFGLSTPSFASSAAAGLQPPAGGGFAFGNPASSAFAASAPASSPAFGSPGAPPAFGAFGTGTLTPGAPRSSTTARKAGAKHKK